MIANVSPKTKLLDAALYLIRSKGYTATTVDDICHAAGVTKGSFFHHFKSKEQLAIEAADHFGAMADTLFASAPFAKLADPLERVLGYLDFRASIVAGELPEYTCLAGTMVQEIYDTHPKIRAACDRCVSAHVRAVAKDIEAAKRLHAPDAAWDPESLSFHFQAVLQGAFVLAKAKRDAAVAVESIRHLRRYVESLFRRGERSSTSTAHDFA